MSHTILEQVQTMGFRVVVRDTQTNEIRTLRLTGQGPWDLDADVGPETSNEDSGPRPRIPALPPPDSAITLRIACTREDSGVRVGAVGSGAIAWTVHQKSLLGAKWQRDERGAPFVLLEKAPTLFADLRAAHPDVTIDTDDCLDTDLLYSGRESPETGTRQTIGRASRRGEKLEATPPGAKVTAEPVTPSAKPPAPPAVAVPDATAPRPRRKRDAVAAGPGELEWVPITENNVEGFAAAWRGGAYKLLHLAGGAYALIFEHGAGGFDMILCGDIDEVRAAAAAHIDAMPADQVVRAACTAKTAKAPCRSPRATRVRDVHELRTLYDTPRFERAFTLAVRDGMSLCADHEGEQTDCDLTVPRALELLRERGEGAVYALEDLRREVSEEPREPSPAIPPRPAPADERATSDLNVPEEKETASARPAKPPAVPASAADQLPAPASASAADQALIDSFAAALTRFEEND